MLYVTVLQRNRAGLSPKVPDAAGELATTKSTMLVTVSHELALHASVVKRSRNSRRIAADQPCVPHPQVPPVLGTAPQRPRGRQSECKQGTPTTGIRRGRRSRCRRSCGCCFLVDVRLQPRDLGLNACLAMSSLLVRPWSNVDSFNTTTLTCPLCREGQTGSDWRPLNLLDHSDNISHFPTRPEWAADPPGNPCNKHPSRPTDHGVHSHNCECKAVGRIRIRCHNNGCGLARELDSGFEKRDLIKLLLQRPRRQQL